MGVILECIKPTNIHIKDSLSNVVNRYNHIIKYYDIDLSKIYNPYYGGWYFKCDVGDCIELSDSNGYDKTSFKILTDTPKGRLFYPHFVREFGNYKNSSWINEHFIKVN
jgi:hypothetical protein